MENGIKIIGLIALTAAIGVSMAANRWFSCAFSQLFGGKLEKIRF